MCTVRDGGVLWVTQGKGRRPQKEAGAKGVGAEWPSPEEVARYLQGVWWAKLGPTCPKPLLSPSACALESVPQTMRDSDG